jgi:hypothetical protein
LILVRILELLAGLFLLALMYWSPTLIAFGRRARNWPAIAVVNSLTGWTLVGWLIALGWSIGAAPATAATGMAVERPRWPKFSWALFASLARAAHLARG